MSPSIQNCEIDCSKIILETGVCYLKIYSAVGMLACHGAGVGQRRLTGQI